MARRKNYNFYNDQFKATAVALTKIAGVKATDVAEALCIHPVMLYRWRMETKRGELKAKKQDIEIEPKMRAELKRPRKLEREHNLLKLEHELLKQAIQHSLTTKKPSSST